MTGEIQIAFIPFFIPAIILYIAYVNYALLITNKRVIKRK